MGGRVLLSPRQRAQMARLRKDLFATRLAVADPSVSVTFTKPDGSSTAAQEVSVEWFAAGGRWHVAQPAGQDRTPDVDLTFSRLTADGFDVAEGWRFAIDGKRGMVARVRHEAGKIVAEARLLTGTVWPS